MPRGAVAQAVRHDERRRRGRRRERVDVAHGDDVADGREEEAAPRRGVALDLRVGPLHERRRGRVVDVPRGRLGPRRRRARERHDEDAVGQGRRVENAVLGVVQQVQGPEVGAVADADDDAPEGPPRGADRPPHERRLEVLVQRQGEQGDEVRRVAPRPGDGRLEGARRGRAAPVAHAEAGVRRGERPDVPGRRPLERVDGLGELAQVLEGLADATEVRGLDGVALREPGLGPLLGDGPAAAERRPQGLRGGPQPSLPRGAGVGRLAKGPHRPDDALELVPRHGRPAVGAPPRQRVAAAAAHAVPAAGAVDVVRRRRRGAAVGRRDELAVAHVLAEAEPAALGRGVVLARARGKRLLEPVRDDVDLAAERGDERPGRQGGPQDLVGLREEDVVDARVAAAARVDQLLDAPEEREGQVRAVGDVEAQDLRGVDRARHVRLVGRRRDADDQRRAGEGVAHGARHAPELQELLLHRHLGVGVAALLGQAAPERDEHERRRRARRVVGGGARLVAGPRGVLGLPSYEEPRVARAAAHRVLVLRQVLDVKVRRPRALQRHARPPVAPLVVDVVVVVLHAQRVAEGRLLEEVAPREPGARVGRDGAVAVAPERDLGRGGGRDAEGQQATHSTRPSKILVAASARTAVGARLRSVARGGWRDATRLPGNACAA